MDIIVNLINLMSEKFIMINDKLDDMIYRNIINIVLSKLDFTPKYHKIIKKDNKIFIKCHSYFINIFNDNDNGNGNDNDNDNGNDEEIKFKTLKYNQSPILTHTGNSCMPPPQYYNDIISNYDYNKCKKNKDLYLCVKYADITIDLDNNNYKIIKSNFNIRKPYDDKFKLFEKIINNIDNPSYYFICNYDLNSLNKTYPDIKNNIYDIYNISISFVNDIDIYIIIDVIMPTITSLSTDIDTKPLVSNQIKSIVVNGGFI